jgi:hypothetical protein
VDTSPQPRSGGSVVHDALDQGTPDGAIAAPGEGRSGAPDGAVGFRNHAAQGPRWRPERPLRRLRWHGRVRRGTPPLQSRPSPRLERLARLQQSRAGQPGPRRIRRSTPRRGEGPCAESHFERAPSSRRSRRQGGDPSVEATCRAIRQRRRRSFRLVRACSRMENSSWPRL